MTRALYAAAWLVAIPFVLVRLWWRGRRQPGYRKAIGERFGRYPPCDAVPRIWVHAVSLGETRAAVPIVEALKARHPGHRILLTHMTPTGRAAGEELFGDTVERAWLPYDLGFAVRAFLHHFRPALGVLLETEIWPRLVQECAAQDVPVVLANARLSERSARGYRRFAATSRRMLSHLSGIAAQTQADARRFESLGASRVTVTGNVKFDLEVPMDTGERGARMRELLGAGRAVWVAGSTRDGEEALLLDAFREIPTDVLLVIVPRHPQRFDAVAQEAEARGFAPVRRSAGARVTSGNRVVVGDTMGEMLVYYAAADVVLMGGSFLEYGSQNLIEPCALGRPVIVGRHTYNFEQAVEEALAAGAAVRVQDAPQALREALALARDAPRRERMGEAARAFVQAHRGATGRLADWLDAALRAGSARRG